MTRYTRIILINEANQGVREYTLSHRVAWFLGVVGILTLAAVIWILLAFGGVALRAAQMPGLSAELQAARADMSRLGQLQGELDELRVLQEKILLMLGVEAPAADSLADLTAAGSLEALAAMVVTPPPDTWPAAGYVTREFSEGEIARGERPHHGLDIAGPEGAPILAAGDGVVARTGEDPFLGIFVEIQHGLGYLTVYGHCRSAAVARGERVRRGQIIAYMGATGQATAPHLHFEIWHNGVAVDPRLFLGGEPAAP